MPVASQTYWDGPLSTSAPCQAQVKLAIVFCMDVSGSNLHNRMMVSEQSLYKLTTVSKRCYQDDGHWLASSTVESGTAPQ